MHIFNNKARKVARNEVMRLKLIKVEIAGIEVCQMWSSQGCCWFYGGCSNNI